MKNDEIDFGAPVLDLKTLVENTIHYLALLKLKIYLLMTIAQIMEDQIIQIAHQASATIMALMEVVMVVQHPTILVTNIKMMRKLEMEQT